MNGKSLISGVFGPLAQGFKELFERDSGPSERRGAQNPLKKVILNSNHEGRITLTPTGIDLDKR